MAEPWRRAAGRAFGRIQISFAERAVRRGGEEATRRWRGRRDPRDRLCASFQPALELRDEDVDHVTAILHRRIVRDLHRRGRLPREDHVEHDEPVLDEPRSRS
jgi:hypothetical protein